MNETMTYIFFRNEGFYPLEMPINFKDKTCYDIARDNAEINEGTIKVEDLHGNILWKKNQ